MQISWRLILIFNENQIYTQIIECLAMFPYYLSGDIVAVPRKAMSKFRFALRSLPTLVIKSDHKGSIKYLFMKSHLRSWDPSIHVSLAQIVLLPPSHITCHSANAKLFECWEWTKMTRPCASLYTYCTSRLTKSNPCTYTVKIITTLIYWHSFRGDQRWCTAKHRKSSSIICSHSTNSE